ncbi:SpaH/EbpB family LPXTG-anchored major pilin [Leucobacter triazinivorans]|uniref:Isopeptide-forming domain-containing fimbrial protein n=1 Tax=Leucobacter triazinivorans TaxID=1784719 RepID=A0A4P6KGC9_9MICO|nr:SpaH/EbpB family LPXTG-anchored major pilin [Leucobacter triazinivorans]QBE49273.1 isopeptide-forming domain-containing fimbrial protein [Leucobacter triazinivorans]
MQASTTRRRIATMVSAAALGLTVLVGSSAAAIAAPQDFGNIDPDRTGSVTVHKFLNQSGTASGDISEAPAAGDFADPVADVEFTVYPLLESGSPLDLTVPENWDGLDALVPGAGCTAPSGFTLGAPVEMPLTVADGSSTVALPVGLYQVCETAAPANIIERALPFILTIPMPHEGGWVYDAHAYPKNGAGSIDKTITPQEDFGLGSVVEFPVTVPVSRMAQEWIGFAIRDTLDDRLVPVAAGDIVVTADGAALDPAFYEIEIVGQQITMEFTAAGLAWLNEGPNAHVGTEIQVVFAGTVIEVGDGVIPNTAQFWPNNPGFDANTQPPLPSPEVRTNWGDLEIVKRAAGTTGAEGTLEGAVFEIYAAEDPYAADCSTAVATGDPVVVDGATSFTSDASGVISLSGLFVSDSVNPVIDNPQRCYVLKETAAPAGYVLPADVFTPVAVLIGDTVSDDVEIENTQQEVPELPLTGAAGQVLLIAGGAAALAVAAGLMLMRRRQAQTTR